MWLFGQTSSAARTALIYITTGALILIWTTVWYVYLRNHPPETGLVYYLCGGLLATGLTLMVIGLGVGWIGRSARNADIPAAVATPPVVSPAVPVTPAQTAASTSATPLVAPEGRMANVQAAAPVSGRNVMA